LDNSESEVHTARVRYFSDGTHGIIIPLLEDITLNSGKHLIQLVKDCRSTKPRHFECLVKWQGFDDVWDTWESLEDVAKTAPNKLQDFLDDNPRFPHKMQIQRSLDSSRR